MAVFTDNLPGLTDNMLDILPSRQNIQLIDNGV